MADNSGTMRENRLKRFRYIEGRNNDERDVVKMMGEIILEGNRGRGKPRKMWMEVITKDMRACDIDDDMIRDSDGRRRNTNS